jgi:hypothetical protein
MAVFNESCGGIVGRSISAANGSFTSHLLVSICDNIIKLNGTTIECANGSEQTVGSMKIDTSSISSV